MGSVPLYIKLFTISFVAIMLASDLYAAPIDDAQATAESNRLIREMESLASRNAWQGVERTYQRLLDSQATITASTHILAGDASISLGDTWEAYQRYFRALQIDDTAAAGQHLRQIRNNFGRVEILRKNKASVNLTAAKSSFQPDVRKSIEHAVHELDETGGFNGMLPVGTYEVNGQTITVAPGLKPTVLKR